MTVLAVLTMPDRGTVVVRREVVIRTTQLEVALYGNDRDRLFVTLADGDTGEVDAIGLVWIFATRLPEGTDWVAWARQWVLDAIADERLAAVVAS